jgi:hypothetical protein
LVHEKNCHILLANVEQTPELSSVVVTFLPLSTIRSVTPPNRIFGTVIDIGDIEEPRRTGQTCATSDSLSVWARCLGPNICAAQTPAVVPVSLREAVVKRDNRGHYYVIDKEGVSRLAALRPLAPTNMDGTRTDRCALNEHIWLQCRDKDRRLRRLSEE